MEERFDIIDHTADIGIVAYGVSREELFENAAFGMFSILTDLEKVEAKDCIRIDVEWEDLEGLLVRWLSELLYYHTSEEYIFRRFHVLLLSDKRVEGEAWGERFDSTRHSLHTEIKTVTYHQLGVEKKGERWEARVIFDI